MKKLKRVLLVWLLPLIVTWYPVNHALQLSKTVIPYSEVTFAGGRAYTTIDIGGVPTLVSTPGPIGDPLDLILYGVFLALLYYLTTALVLFIITDHKRLQDIRSTFSQGKPFKL